MVDCSAKMAEFCHEEEFLSFLDEFPDDLFGLNEEKVISLDDIFNSGILMTTGTTEPNLLLPVQVEDSNLTTQASQETLKRTEKKCPTQPHFITCRSSDDRTISMASNVIRKRKRATDELSDDSDSDDEESAFSAPESREKSLKFVEQFLALGIHCKQNFWQYNQELRGPKPKRLLPALDEGDFHILNSCIDPTYDDSTQNAVISSSSSSGRSKVRRAEGNDVRPDPLKLLDIGSRISGMEEMFKSKDVKESSGKARKTIGREKNILASRICRLRKKAQHEANKIKLEGLQREQNQLIRVSLSMLNVMHDHIMKSAMQLPNAGHSTTSSLCALLNAFISQHLGFMVAGHTVEYVNKELEVVAKQQQLSGCGIRVGRCDGDG